jgi:glucose 1-dehydrogenase
LTKGMSIALAPHGIRVNAVGPATIVTDLNRDYLEEHPEVYAKRLQRTPLGRLGTPDDVVNGVLYLASDVAGFVTGTTLFMDAGRLAQNTVPEDAA